ncbi:hypothetical protein [Streptomyces caniferus]
MSVFREMDLLRAPLFTTLVLMPQRNHPLPDRGSPARSSPPVTSG